MESQQGIEAIVDAPSDLAVAIDGLEETDGPSLNGERGREEEESFLSLILIGMGFGERTQIAIGDEGGIKGNGDEFFVLKPREDPIEDLGFQFLPLAIFVSEES